MKRIVCLWNTTGRRMLRSCSACTRRVSHREYHYAYRMPDGRAGRAVAWLAEPHAAGCGLPCARAPRDGAPVHLGVFCGACEALTTHGGAHAAEP